MSQGIMFMISSPQLKKTVETPAITAYIPRVNLKAHWPIHRIEDHSANPFHAQEWKTSPIFFTFTLKTQLEILHLVLSANHLHSHS